MGHGELGIKNSSGSILLPGNNFCIIHIFMTKDLLPKGNHVPEGEALKAFQSVNG